MGAWFNLKVDKYEVQKSLGPFFLKTCTKTYFSQSGSRLADLEICNRLVRQPPKPANFWEAYTGQPTRHVIFANKADKTIKVKS